MVSYGPCQTPTLGFVVNRHLRIQKFVKETFWSLFCEYGEKRDNRNGSDYAEFAWNRTSVGMFDRACAIMFLEICLANPVAKSKPTVTIARTQRQGIDAEPRTTHLRARHFFNM